MNDARLSTGLPSHPKTKKLIRRLGPAGAWHLVCLILWARDNRSDGDFSGLSAEDIELSIDWAGEPDAFVSALCDVGFLDGKPGEYRFHDWAEHQPWAAGAALRSAKAKWNAIKGHHGESAADAQVPEWAAARSTIPSKQHASSTSDSMLDDADSSAPSPSPSPSPKQKTLRPSLREDADPELAELLADIPADLLRDYKKVRKAKKAALTARAVRGLIEAGRKGGKTLREVLEICCAESWVGYNHTWTRANNRNSPINGVNHETHRNLSAVERVRESATRGELADRAARQPNGHADLVGQDGGDLRTPLDLVLWSGGEPGGGGGYVG